MVRTNVRCTYRNELTLCVLVATDLSYLILRLCSVSRTKASAHDFEHRLSVFVLQWLRQVCKVKNIPIRMCTALAAVEDHHLNTSVSTPAFPCEVHSVFRLSRYAINLSTGGEKRITCRWSCLGSRCGKHCLPNY